MALPNEPDKFFSHFKAWSIEISPLFPFRVWKYQLFFPQGYTILILYPIASQFKLMLIVFTFFCLQSWEKEENVGSFVWIWVTCEPKAKSRKEVKVQRHTSREIQLCESACSYGDPIRHNSHVKSFLNRRNQASSSSLMKSIDRINSRKVTDLSLCLSLNVPCIKVNSKAFSKLLIKLYLTWSVPDHWEWNEIYNSTLHL